MFTFKYLRENPDVFANYKHKDLVPLICSQCNLTYHRTKRIIRRGILYKNTEKNFCSTICAGNSNNTSITEPCANCQKLVTRNLAERLSAKNIFCNSSCAASYNNKHKAYGTRRSKLEVFLEEQLRILYPSLQIIANGKEAIESELDFYFPELRFAIELNGPTHYEPIYGADKFEKIQAGDRQKLIRCYEAGIELMIVDVSKVTYLNKERKKYFLDILTSQLNSLMGRI